MAGGAAFEWPIKVVEIDAKKAAGTDPDGLVPVGDAAFIMPADIGTVPMDDDKIVVGGDTWIVLSVKRLSPGGVPLMYTVQVRK
jgi:hypothetical protein